jgi:hypothetical protein
MKGTLMAFMSMRVPFMAFGYCCGG